LRIRNEDTDGAFELQSFGEGKTSGIETQVFDDRGLEEMINI